MKCTNPKRASLPSAWLLLSITSNLNNMITGVRCECEHEQETLTRLHIMCTELINTGFSPDDSWKVANIYST